MELFNIAIDLRDTCNDFSDLFKCHRYDNTVTAHHYMCGLMQAERSNMERMEEKVVDSDYESIQQFISNSPWDARAVFNRVAMQGNILLNGTGKVGLLIDETAYAKKGKASVGVGRQWNGRLGKTENSQVGVYGVLSSGVRAIIVDVELFLPKEWTDDQKRCEKLGIPEDRFTHKTKPELGIDIVNRQRELGVHFDYVCADGLYGHSGEFCRELDDNDEVFLTHVHSNQRIYLEDPKPIVPERSFSKGKAPTKLKAQSPSKRVDILFKELLSSELKPIVVRDTTVGELEVNTYRRKIWCWNGEEKEAREWTLFIRQDIQSPSEIKYCLTNAAKDTSTLDIARMEAQRFWIERSFEDAKSQAGMADYQVRGWRAWHHHMALVMMTMLFMTKQRMLHKESCPKLSCYDIKVLLCYFLPRRDTTIEEILRQMEVRHAKRNSASANAKKRRQAERQSSIHT